MRGHRKPPLHRAIALAWADAGITTVTMAKGKFPLCQRILYYFKSMGISGRNPVDTDFSYEHLAEWLWFHGYHPEACSRTVLSTGQPSFQYADKILSGWKIRKIKCPYTCRCPAPRCPASAPEAGKNTQRKGSFQPAASNRFNNNFHQRQYDWQIMKEITESVTVT